jgi:hypothetical protein
MKTSFRVEDRLEGATNFKAWKIKLLLILEENDLLDYINQDIPESVEDEEKVKHKKKTKRDDDPQSDYSGGSLQISL